MVEKRLKELIELIKCPLWYVPAKIYLYVIRAMSHKKILCCTEDSSQPMENVGTTETGQQFCLSCIRKNVHQMDSAAFGNINATVVDVGWSKLCGLLCGLSAAVREFDNNLKRKSLNEMTDMVPAKKRALNVAPNDDSCDTDGNPCLNSNLKTGSYIDLSSTKNSAPRTPCHQTQAAFRQFFESKTGAEALFSAMKNIASKGIDDFPQNRAPTYEIVQDQDIANELLINANLNSIGFDSDDDDDSFVPPTPQSNKSESKKCLMGTGLSIKSRQILHKFAQHFDCDVLDYLSPAVQCVIVDEHGITLKWLYARCRRVPIVKSSWMKACLKEGRFLPMDAYLREKIGFPIPSIMRFLDVALCPPFDSYSEADIKAILKEVETRVSDLVSWRPLPDRVRMIVGVNETIPYDEPELKKISEKYQAPIVDISYIMLILEAGELRPIQPHLILNTTQDQLLRFGLPEQIVVDDGELL